MIAASAGNHAQAVAYHGTRLGIPVTIVMPKPTPTVKVMQTDRPRRQGRARRRDRRRGLRQGARAGARTGLTFVHPFDDPQIIAGAGTVGARNAGGRARPRHARRADRRRRADLRHGHRRACGQARHRADRRPGRALPVDEMHDQGLPPAAWRRHARRRHRGQGAGRADLADPRELVDDIVLVPERDLENAVAMLLAIEKTVVEGAGAAGLAAILSDLDRFAGRRSAPCCAAAISTRACSPTCCCATSPARAGSRGSSRGRRPPRRARRDHRQVPRSGGQHHRDLPPAGSSAACRPRTR